MNPFALPSRFEVHSWGRPTDHLA